MARLFLVSRLSRLPAAASLRRLLRPLAATGSLLPAALFADSRAPARCFAPQSESETTSSLNRSSRSPPHEPATYEWSDVDFDYDDKPAVYEGCDFEHWLVIMAPPPGDPANPDVPRGDIIDGYIKTLAQVVGSEEEARQKIYSVSTRHYFAFGALVSEKLADKLKQLPKVRWVLPDTYQDVENKDYEEEEYFSDEGDLED